MNENHYQRKKKTCHCYRESALIYYYTLQFWGNLCCNGFEIQNAVRSLSVTYHFWAAQCRLLAFITAACSRNPDLPTHTILSCDTQFQGKSWVLTTWSPFHTIVSFFVYHRHILFYQYFMSITITFVNKILTSPFLVAGRFIGLYSY